MGIFPFLNIRNTLNKENKDTAQAMVAVRRALQLQITARQALEKGNVPQYSSYRTEVFHVLGAAAQAAQRVNVDVNRLRKQAPSTIANQESRLIHDILGRIIDVRKYTAGSEMSPQQARKKSFEIENKLRGILREENVLRGVERKIQGTIR